MSDGIVLGDDEIQKFISAVITETMKKEHPEDCKKLAAHLPTHQVISSPATGWTDRHEQMEFEIISLRVIRVLDILIERIELLLCLPAMMENPMIEEHLSQEQIDLLKESILAPEHTQISELLNTISHSTLMEKVPEFRDTISMEGNTVLENLRELRKIAGWRMKMTSAREIIKERMLHQMYKDNAVPILLILS